MWSKPIGNSLRWSTYFGSLLWKFFIPDLGGYQVLFDPPLWLEDMFGQTTSCPTTCKARMPKQLPCFSKSKLSTLLRKRLIQQSMCRSWRCLAALEECVRFSNVCFDHSQRASCGKWNAWTTHLQLFQGVKCCPTSNVSPNTFWSLVARWPVLWGKSRSKGSQTQKYSVDLIFDGLRKCHHKFDTWFGFGFIYLPRRGSSLIDWLISSLMGFEPSLWPNWLLGKQNGCFPAGSLRRSQSSWSAGSGFERWWISRRSAVTIVEKLC